MFAKRFTTDKVGLTMTIALPCALAFAVAGAIDKSPPLGGNDMSAAQSKSQAADMRAAVYVEAARNELMLSRLLLQQIRAEPIAARRAHSAQDLATALVLANDYRVKALAASVTEQSFDLVHELETDLRTVRDEAANAGIAIAAGARAEPVGYRR